MANITPLDRLFVTLLQNGMAKYIAELTGVTSLSDIVFYLRKNCPDLNGLATIAVRNATSGWSASRSVLFK